MSRICSIFFKNINPKVAELEGKATGLLSAAEKYDLRVRQLRPYFNSSLIFVRDLVLENISNSFSSEVT